MLRSRAIHALAIAALTAALSAQTTVLQLGIPNQADLPAGQSHSYSVTLAAGQYLRAVIAQPVPHATVALDSPEGRQLLEIDTRNFSKPSRIVWVAETAGEYRIRVTGPGSYEIKLEELRPAAAADLTRVEAERLLIQGRSQARQNQYDSAIATYSQAQALYRTLNDRERQGDILHATAAAYANLGQYQKAAGLYEQALPIRREAHDRSGEADTLNNLGAVNLSLSQYQKGIDYYQQALAIRRELKDRPGEAAALHGLGSAWLYLSQNDKAIDYYQQALAIRREVNDRAGQGASLGNIGLAWLYLGQFEKAIGYYEQQLAISREIQDRRSEGTALTNLGEAYADLSQNEKAIGYFEQALALSRAVQDRSTEASALNNLGIAYRNLSQYDKAIGYYQQALDMRRAMNDRRNEGAALVNLGLTYLYLSQSEKAIACYEQALAIFREVKDRHTEGVTLVNFGFAYDRLSQYEKAIDYYQQALVIIREVKDRQNEGVALNNLGDASLNLGRNQQALDYYRQALAVVREVKDRYAEGAILSGLGDASRRLSQYEEAMGYYQQALAIRREVKDRQGEGATLSNLGDASHALGRNDEAAAYYAQALAISREVKDRNAEAAELSGLMDTCQASAQPRLAIFYGKQAVNTVQSMRADIHGLGPDLQRSFLQGNEKTYHTLAGILIAQGRLAEAEQVLALLKEEEYFQYIRRDADGASTLKGRAGLTPDEAEWERRYREIGDRLMAIGAEHGELLAKKTLTAEQQQRLANLEQDLTAGNRAFEHFLGDLTQHFSAKPEMAHGVDTLRQRQDIMENLRELPPGTVAIFTLIGDDQFYAVLRTPDAQKAYRYPIKAADLNRKIEAFRQVVQDPELDPRPLAQELYKILVAGMAADLRQAKAQTLMWSLDGALRYVPLAALYDGRQYLIEQYRLSVMTLANNMSLKDRPDRKWRAAGFGVTRQFEDAAALPAVAAELTGIIATRPGDGGVLAGEIKLDDQFTRQTMRETLLKRYPVVHIASHFRFQPGNETRSYLQLGDGAHLSLADLRTSPNLFGGVQLLTLSACNTGMGDGTEVEGFGALAQMQGAKAVIASLWPVEDQSTSRLMQELYRIRESARGLTKLEALRQSQLKLLRGDGKARPGGQRARGDAPEPGHPDAPRFPLNPTAPFAHPFYWAPFFLMGNWL